MVNLKRIMVSGLFAIAISCLQVWASIHFSKTILWQVQLMQSFVGKGPILGYRNGLPLYEATPVHMISTYIGLGIGFLVYWVIGLGIIKVWHNKSLEESTR